MRIRFYQIIGTQIVIGKAFEPSSYTGPHFALMTDDRGQIMGNVATRNLPPEIDALPARTQERFDAAHAFFDACKGEAEAAILAASARAGLSGGTACCGEVSFRIEPGARFKSVWLDAEEVVR